MKDLYFEGLSRLLIPPGRAHAKQEKAQLQHGHGGQDFQQLTEGQRRAFRGLHGEANEWGTGAV